MKIGLLSLLLKRDRNHVQAYTRFFAVICAAPPWAIHGSPASGRGVVAWRQQWSAHLGPGEHITGHLRQTCSWSDAYRKAVREVCL
jgi:hypothetical protein